MFIFTSTVATFKHAGITEVSGSLPSVLLLACFPKSRLETIKYKVMGNSYILLKIMLHYQDSALAYVSIFANGTNFPTGFCVRIHR